MRLTSAPHFTKDTLAFLRALKRHNDREWFREHRPLYDEHVLAPMLTIIDRLAHDLPRVAPQLVVSPKVALYRIYRDTRFSSDKSPLKTHVAAIFPWRGLQKHEGAGLYFEVAPGHCWIGGGMYAPQPWQLRMVREQIASRPREFRRIVESLPFRRAVGELDGERLRRVPSGFPPDHQAAEYLKFRQFLAGREFPGTFATTRGFYVRLLAIFRAIAPLTRFLNEPLIAAKRDWPLGLPIDTRRSTKLATR
jgi:uncharacterized protein (TIGR02453 family)